MNGIKSGKVGFMGGPKANPTYREVCGGRTGHVEVYDCEFDGKESTYENMVKHFFMFHDPTTVDRQGNDRGSQYASVIFYYDQKQKEIATKILADLQEALDKGSISGYQGRQVVTQIREASAFYAAMDSHQEYLRKNPSGYCNHFMRFEEFPK